MDVARPSDGVDMTFANLLFYVFAAILVFAAIRVITASNPVHAVLNLVLAFFTAGGLWMLLRAEFLAIALVLVYVGAVMVLFLFVIMMLDINIERMRERFWSNLPFGLVVGGLLIAEMSLVLTARYFDLDAMPEAAEPPAGYSNTKELGRLIYTQYAYPFELAAVILLVAIIAAIALTHRVRPENKRVDPAQQIAVKRKDRVRVLSMPAEKD